MPTPLIQEWFPLQYTLEEGKDGKTVLRGEFGRVDTPTQNKRLYSRQITQKEIDRLNEDLKTRRVYGELDHPSDGKTKYQRVSHLITNLHIEDDGRVIGEAEVLDTPNGRIVEAIAKANGGLGVSSRGFGSVTTREDGVHVVGEDFRLKTYDIVVDPAMRTAHPEVFAEALMESDEYDWLKEFQSDFPEVVEQITEAVRKEEAERAKKDAEKAVADAIGKSTDAATGEQREEFERKLAGALVSLREGVKEDLREEYESDPKRGAATAVLEQIAKLVAVFTPDSDEKAVRDALKAKDVEIAKVSESAGKWKEMARELGYKLCVTQETADHPMRETILLALGDMSQFKSVEEVRTAVRKIREDLAEVVPSKEEKKEQEESEAVAGKNGEIKALKERLDEMERKHGDAVGRLQRAVQIGEELNEQLTEAKNELREAKRELAEAQSETRSATLSETKANAVRGYANAHKLMKLLENVDDESVIQEMVEEYGREEMSDSRLEELRRKLGRGVRHDGRDTLAEGVQPGPVNLPRSTSALDQTPGEILTLAGVTQPLGG